MSTAKASLLVALIFGGAGVSYLSAFSGLLQGEAGPGLGIFLGLGMIGLAVILFMTNKGGK